VHDGMRKEGMLLRASLEKCGKPLGLGRSGSFFSLRIVRVLTFGVHRGWVSSILAVSSQ
jgi:hypothetical protein